MLNFFILIVRIQLKSFVYLGDLSGLKDTCQGDSGGPLYVKDTVNGEMKYVLSGIVSYGMQLQLLFL